MLIHTAKKTRLSLPNKTSLGIYTGYGGVAGFTRTTTKTCWGYLENALPGDFQYLLTIPSDVPCFPGMRFLSSNNTWSDKYANGVAIASANNTGQLIEPARTNLYLNSKIMQYSGGVTILPNADIAPDGTLTATKYTESLLNEAHYIQQNKNVTPGTFSAEVKSAGTQYIMCGAAWWGDASFSPVFDIVNGTVVKTSGAEFSNVTITKKDNGWCVCSVTRNYTGGYANQYIYLLNSSTPSRNSETIYTGNGASGILVSNVQIENAAFNTSIITTSGATVTRNADNQTIQTAQNINRYQGSLSFEFTPTHNAAGTVALGGSYVDANNYTQILHIAGTGYIFRKRIDGVNYDATLSGAFVANTTYTVKIKWSTGSGIDIFINGVKGINNNDTKPLQLGSTWQIGADGNGGQQAGACFKNVLTNYK